MGKRYGRNQKRRHREQISMLQHDAERFATANSMNEGLAHHMSCEYLGAMAKLNEVREVIAAVCRYSVALDPAVVRDFSADRPTNRRSMRVDVVEAMPLPEVSIGDVWPDCLTYKTVDVHALELFLEENREAVGHAVHLEYAGEPGSTAYMISRNALLSVPEDLLVKRLAPKIAEHLVRILRRVMTR